MLQAQSVLIYWECEGRSSALGLVGWPQHPSPRYGLRHCIRCSCNLVFR